MDKNLVTLVAHSGLLGSRDKQSYQSLSLETYNKVAVDAADHQQRIAEVVKPPPPLLYGFHSARRCTLLLLLLLPLLLLLLLLLCCSSPAMHFKYRHLSHGLLQHGYDFFDLYTAACIRTFCQHEWVLYFENVSWI
jgi:hypothetical protein